MECTESTATQRGTIFPCTQTTYDVAAFMPGQLHIKL